jgi:Zn-dependent protease with chaperone function
VGTAAGIAIALGVLLAPSQLPAVVILAWVSVLAGGFRARKAVFDETWSFASYLAHALRFWLGLVGSFVLIASIPWAMAISGDDAFEVGIALGAAAWLWVLTGPLVFRRLVRARPLDGPEAEGLAPLFSRILERAKCRAPAIYVAEARGGSWVNAFALPAVRRPGVLFTRGFLGALTPEETAAIFAHEVAHLEHFQPRKVLLGRALALVLVVLPIFLWAGPLSDFLRGWEWIWPIAFLIAFAARAGKSRGHESESDRRALELSADPDALVSGLTKLHSLNRLSRRWDAAYEALSTHPSLARRIRAIRAVSGKQVPEEELEVIFRAADGSDRAVLFDAARVHWLRGVPEDGEDLLARSEERRSYRYENIVELRLQGERELVMKDKPGETARMAVGAEDVSAMEQVLDRVDGLLSDTPTTAEAPTGRIWSVVLGLLGLIPSISWVVAALACPPRRPRLSLARRSRRFSPLVRQDWLRRWHFPIRGGDPPPSRSRGSPVSSSPLESAESRGAARRSSSPPWSRSLSSYSRASGPRAPSCPRSRRCTRVSGPAKTLRPSSASSRSRASSPVSRDRRPGSAPLLRSWPRSGSLSSALPPFASDSAGISSPGPELPFP